MNIDYIQQMSYIVTGYLSRINHGFLLTEDEAMFYYATLRYLKQANRLLEIAAKKAADEEERKSDDENDGAGRSAPDTSPPT